MSSDDFVFLIAHLSPDTERQIVKWDKGGQDLVTGFFEGMKKRKEKYG